VLHMTIMNEALRIDIEMNKSDGREAGDDDE